MLGHHDARETGLQEDARALDSATDERGGHRLLCRDHASEQGPGRLSNRLWRFRSGDYSLDIRHDRRQTGLDGCRLSRCRSHGRSQTVAGGGLGRRQGWRDDASAIRRIEICAGDRGNSHASLRMSVRVWGSGDLAEGRCAVGHGGPRKRRQGRRQLRRAPCRTRGRGGGYGRCRIDRQNWSPVSRVTISIIVRVRVETQPFQAVNSKARQRCWVASGGWPRLGKEG